MNALDAAIVTPQAIDPLQWRHRPKPVNASLALDFERVIELLQWRHRPKPVNARDDDPFEARIEFEASMKAPAEAGECDEQGHLEHLRDVMLQWRHRPKPVNADLNADAYLASRTASMKAPAEAGECIVERCIARLKRDRASMKAPAEAGECSGFSRPAQPGRAPASMKAPAEAGECIVCTEKILPSSLLQWRHRPKPVNAWGRGTSYTCSTPLQWRHRPKPVNASRTVMSAASSTGFNEGTGRSRWMLDPHTCPLDVRLAASMKAPAEAGECARVRIAPEEGLSHASMKAPAEAGECIIRTTTEGQPDTDRFNEGTGRSRWMLRPSSSRSGQGDRLQWRHRPKPVNAVMAALASKSATQASMKAPAEAGECKISL